MLSLEDTFIQTIGEGERIIVFHGGPGFNHEYLVPHLSFLSKNHEIVYFDQYGSGRTSCSSDDITFHEISSHAAKVLSQFQQGNSVRFIAHSFGIAVLLKALSHLPDLEVNGLILNAVPTNKFRFDAMRNDLFSKMGPDVVATLPAASEKGLSENELMHLLQFYISPNSNPDLSGLMFDFPYYSQVYASLDHYDVSSSVSRIKESTLVIGEDDFIDPDLISDISRACKRKVSFTSSGHFTFAEKPEEFQDIATRTFS